MNIIKDKSDQVIFLFTILQKFSISVRVKDGLSNYHILSSSAHAISPCPPLVSSLHTSPTQFAVLSICLCMLFCWNVLSSLHLAQFHHFFKTLALATPPPGSFPCLTFTTTPYHLQTVLGTILRVSFITLCIKIVHFNRQCLAPSEF